MKIVVFLLAAMMFAAVSVNAQSDGMPHRSIMYKKKMVKWL
jgi:hypothetical protein